MNERNIPAKTENLPEVLAFIDECLEKTGCPLKIQVQIQVAAEEIFVNIAHYAYPQKTGMAAIRTEVQGIPPVVVITFTDQGIPYNPLAQEPPDVARSAEDREIGGLGILLVKKNMDDISYEYKDGQNILTLKKIIAAPA